MITKNDLDTLYLWAKNQKFSLTEELTSAGYPSKPILYCLLKLSRKLTRINKKYVKDDLILKILLNPDILMCSYVVFQPGIEHGPHRDSNLYKKDYKRVQIPIKVPNEKCYMIWKGEKIIWKPGVYGSYEVMDYTHEGYNYSDTSLEFLFLDVKKNAEVELS